MLRAVIILLFSYGFVFSFCDIIPQSADEARELLWDEIIDSACFAAVEALLLNPIDPISEGWSRLETLGFDLAPDEVPTNREILASGGDLSRLFRRYPLIAQFENFIRISRRSLQISPVRSTLGVLARRTHGDDEQFFSVSSVTRIQDNLLVSAQIRERQGEQYMESRSFQYTFSTDGLRGFFYAGNLSSPSNELLFGRYAAFSQTRGADNFLYASRGGYNGIITQVGMQNFAATGYFHAGEDERILGGGVFVQPQYFRMEMLAIHAKKDENEDVLLQIRGNFVNLGLSVSNAVSLSSGKYASLLRYERAARNLRIISQTYILQEGFNSAFSSLAARNQSAMRQIFGSRLSLSGRTGTQSYSLSTRYRLVGDLGTASASATYRFPEITGFGLRSNFSYSSDGAGLRQTHGIFNRKRIRRNLRTNASLSNSFNNDGWRHSIFSMGLDGFLPNLQQISAGYSLRTRRERESQGTLSLSYSSASPSRTTRAFTMDIPFFETARGMRVYGEMRFAFPVFDNRRL